MAVKPINITSVLDAHKEAFICPYCEDDGIEITDATVEKNEHGIKTLVSIYLFCRACKSKWAASIMDVNHKNTFIAAYRSETKINYYEYIESDKWKEKAKEAKDRAGYRCQLCNSGEKEKVLHAHHRTYERLGDELPEDITVLCADCHAKFHDK